MMRWWEMVGLIAGAKSYVQETDKSMKAEGLARYQELARLHEDELKSSRSAIQQFVLSPPAKAPAKANDEELSHK
jgi:hypothetical protein